MEMQEQSTPVNGFSVTAYRPSTGKIHNVDCKYNAHKLLASFRESYKHFAQMSGEFRNVLLLDMDATLRDDRGRIKYLPDRCNVDKDKPNAAYDKYHAMGHEDSLIAGNILITRSIIKNLNCPVIVLTSCTDVGDNLKTIEAQLSEANIYWDLLVMRDRDNQLHPHVYKQEFLNALGLPDEGKIIAYDDNSEICQMMVERGITVIQAHTPYKNIIKR